MAGELQGKNVNIYIDDAPALEAYERLSKKQDGYNKKIEDGEKKADELGKAIKKALDAGKSPEAFQKKLDAVNKSLDKNREAAAKVTEQQKALSLQMESKSGPSLKSQAALVQRLYNEYQRLGANTKEAEQKLLEYAAAGRVLDGMRERVTAVRRAQDDAAKSGSSFFGSFFGNIAANVVSRAASLIDGFFSDATQEALDAEESTARFAATLSNLGRTDAFDRIMAKADQLADKFSYLDNDDIVGVFNKLIDYGKLTEKQMNDLLPVIIDFAAKQRITIGESADVITKALEGNGKALKIYGIDLKDAKTEAERLEVVMTTLKNKVEGTGEAFMNTAAGGIAEARQEFADTKEEIGNGLIPALTSLMRFSVGAVKGLKQFASDLGNSFSDVWTLLTDGQEAAKKKFQDRNAAQMAAVGKAAADEYLKGFQSADVATIEAEIQKKLADLNAKQKLAANKNTFGDLKQTAQEGVKQLNLQIQGLMQLKNSLLNDNEALGISSGGGKKEKSKKDPKIDQAKKDAEDLAKYLKQKAFELSQFDATEQEKELDRAYQTWQEKKLLAHGNQAQLKRLEELYWVEVTQIQTKYGRLQTAEFEKRQQERVTRMEDIARAAMSGGMQKLRSVSEAIAAGLERADKKRLDAAELKVLQSSGRGKLQAQLGLLKEQESQELLQKGLTEERKLIIEEEYRQRRKEAEAGYYTSLAENYHAYAQQVLTLATLFDQLQTAREEKQLAKLQNSNDRQKNAYQRLLNNKLISQQEYNRRIAAMDADLDAKKAQIEKKQWERQKKINIAQAIANGAMAITKILAETPKFDFGVATAIQIGLAAATTAGQIAVIAKQQPQFKDGGTLLHGPQHKDGGVQLYGRNGHHYGEAEGGEVILSRKTVRNNPDLVGALLHSSMKRGGQRIEPAYRTRSYQSIDYSGMSRSIQRTRFFANGGTVPAQSVAPGAQATQVVSVVPDEVVSLLVDLRGYLAQTPKAYVVLSEYQAQAAQMENIKKDATFQRQ